METLVVVAIVVLGAAAVVAFGVVLAPGAEPERMGRTGPRGRRWPRIVGGLLLAVLGCIVALGSYVSTVQACDVPAFGDWWPVESRGNAVAMTSGVLEFHTASGGLTCGDNPVLQVRASAWPTGRKPVFLGVGGVDATRRYLGTGRYEIAATYMSLLATRRVGDSTRRLAPPGSKQFWRSSVISSAPGPGGQVHLTHRWRAVGGGDPFSWPRFGTPISERFWLVLVNADGSPGVAARLTFEVGYAPIDNWPGWIGMLAGMALAATGIVLAGHRPSRRPGSARDSLRPNVRISGG